MNVMDLRDSYNSTSFEAIKQSFRESPPVTPKFFFKQLGAFLLPYQEFVHALFAVPDHFEKFPYNYKEPPQFPLLPLVANFQDAHTKYQKDFRILHSIFGLAGEVLELEKSTDEENTLEEQGDLLFYLMAFLLYTDKPVASLFQDYKAFGRTPYAPYIWYDFAEQGIDVTKKIIFYKQLEKGLLVNTKDLWNIAARLLGGDTSLTTTYRCNTAINALQPILTGNLDKLIKRYPTLVFSTELSHARADKQ